MMYIIIKFNLIFLRKKYQISFQFEKVFNIQISPGVLESCPFMVKNMYTLDLKLMLWTKKIKCLNCMISKMTKPNTLSPLTLCSSSSTLTSTEHPIKSGFDSIPVSSGIVIASGIVGFWYLWILNNTFLYTNC